MNHYLVEVEEKVIHVVTIAANDPEHAQVQAMNFKGEDFARLAPVFSCLSVRELDSDNLCENLPSARLEGD